MTPSEILDRIARGRTDLVFELLAQPDWQDLSLLGFGEHRIGERSRRAITSDHGAGWGNGMEWNLVGDYLPENLD